MARKLTDLVTSALKVIPSVVYHYRLHEGSEINELGNTVHTYTEWVRVVGMVEPGIASAFGTEKKLGSSVDISTALGLNTAGEVISVWIRGVDFKNTKESTGCDQIIYQGKIYNVKHVADWLGYNNWKQFIAQEVIVDVGEEEVAQ